ncbi:MULTISPECIES: superinfection immunity protein [unclassified Helicobacter]|uniref:superinfection immunity protein n=1 Tax=unclassified Helicobacter TaxID=2593540 RepID=UPI000CF1AAEB|nr:MULTISPECIES: superinfection immunity protein [unclassified Helicobacter]
MQIIDGIEIINENSFFTWHWAVAIFIGILCFFIYFLPTFIAIKRKHSSRYGILVINLFFGFTFIGWIISLAWSVSKKD